MKKRSLILLLAAALLAGCHGTRPVTADQPAATDQPTASDTPGKPGESGNSGNSGISGISGNTGESGESGAPATPHKRTYTVVAFDGVVEGIGVNGQLRIAEDSVMWVTVSKIIEVGRAMCTPDSLWLRAPLLGHDDAIDYATLRRVSGKKVSFAELQQAIQADNAEERIAAMARKMGIKATVRITSRRTVDSLSFPYSKPKKP